jgi:hypothetical protein
MPILTPESLRTFLNVGTKLVFEPNTHHLYIYNFENGMYMPIYWDSSPYTQLNFIKTFSEFCAFAKFLALTLGLDTHPPRTKNNTWHCVLCKSINYNYIIRAGHFLLHDELTELTRVLPKNFSPEDLVNFDSKSKGVVQLPFILHPSAFSRLAHIIADTHWLTAVLKNVRSKLKVFSFDKLKNTV